MKFNTIQKVLLCVFLTTLFSSNSIFNNLLSNEDYITGDDGVVRMYINVTGHVKSPGTYLAYDTIDFMTAISLAGGYLKGSNLSKILIISLDGNIREVDLNKYFIYNESYENIKLNPHDTIYVQEKLISKIFLSSNLPTMLLSLMNMAITIMNI